MRLFMAIVLAVAVLGLAAPPAVADELAADVAPAALVAVSVVGGSVAMNLVNVSRLGRGEPGAGLGYAGLAFGGVILARGVTMDDANDLRVGLTTFGAVSTLISGITIYAAHTRGREDAAVAPLLTPGEDGDVGVGLQVRLTF